MNASHRTMLRKWAFDPFYSTAPAGCRQPDESPKMNQPVRFIGTKTVLAQRMTRAAWCAFRGWEVPANENGTDAGYLVEYTDGGTPNVAGHVGYVSWSPKAQFENAYRERPAVPGLAPHQQRVVDERAELNEKIVKLSEFFDTPIFKGLDPAEQHRLNLQGLAMTTYSCVLDERIAAF